MAWLADAVGPCLSSIIYPISDMGRFPREACCTKRSKQEHKGVLTEVFPLFSAQHKQPPQQNSQFLS